MRLWLMSIKIEQSPLESTGNCICHISGAYTSPLCEKMASSTKLEIHDILHVREGQSLGDGHHA